MAMLHSIWLVVGPSLDSVAWFLASVRTVTTDMGVERGVCDFASPLLLFAEYMGLACPAHFSQPHLMWNVPSAIFVPGWNRIFSNLLNDSLSSLKV